MTSLLRKRGFSASLWCCAGAAAANPSVGSKAESTASEAAKISEDLLTMANMCRNIKDSMIINGLNRWRI